MREKKKKKKKSLQQKEEEEGAQLGQRLGGGQRERKRERERERERKSFGQRSNYSCCLALVLDDDVVALSSRHNHQPLAVLL